MTSTLTRTARAAPWSQIGHIRVEVTACNDRDHTLHMVDGGLTSLMYWLDDRVMDRVSLDREPRV